MPPPPASSRSGSILALRVGDGVSSFVTGNTSALFFDEIDVVSGAVMRSIPVPAADNGANLACTLST